MKTVFFTWITNDFKDTIVDYRSFYKSFKYFHPDIDLIVFDDEKIKEVFGSESWLCPVNCKAAFAKRLYDDYDLVVNVDADFYFFDRCHEILEGDYDVAACANFNSCLNTQLKGGYNIGNRYIPDVDYVHYVQAGLIASTQKEFWNDFHDASRDLWNKFPCFENDTLNIVWFSGKYKTKILDGDYDYRSSNFKQYYNCSILGKERLAVIQNDRVTLDNKPVRSYHVAYGNSGPNGPRKSYFYDRFVCRYISPVNWT